MSDNFTHVLIFKTNIHTEEDKSRIKEFLNAHSSVEEASVDIEDVDRVLRVVSYYLKPAEVISLVKENGINCEELE